MNGYLSLQLEDSKDALDFIVERGMRQAVSRVSGQGEEITGPGVRDQPLPPYPLFHTSKGLLRALYRHTILPALPRTGVCSKN